MAIAEDIKGSDFSGALQKISPLSELVPQDIDKSSVLNKLIHYISQVPVSTLSDVKMWTSTLTNMLQTLNKPHQLSIKPEMMKCILGLVKRQAAIFSTSIFNRVISQTTPASEIRHMASYILTCLHYILMCKDPSTKHVPSDGYKLKLLNELRKLSVFAEEIIDLIKEAVSYVQLPGEPPSRVPSANDFFVLWTMENDDDNEIIDMLSKYKNIPVNMSEQLFTQLQKTLRPTLTGVSQTNTNLGLQVVHIDESIFWWGEFEVKSSLISVSITSHYDTLRKTQIRSIPSPLDLYLKLDNSAKTVKVTESTIQLDPNTDDLELDLKVKVHRIDRGPRSHTTIVFHFPPTNSTLRVLITDDFRPDYTMMTTQSKNISDKFPEYHFHAHNENDVRSFLFIGIIPGPEVPVNQTITYTFEVSTIVCKYWQRGRWSSVGCEVIEESKDKSVHCQCTHVSIFGAAFPVPPHEIDPFADAKLFLTALDNPLVVAVVVTLLLLYLVACIFMWRLDRGDKIQKSVLILDDNFPGSKYPYLIAVYTSSRFNAGTTAHVALRLTGTISSSRVHVLNSKVRRVLKRNSDDWFLMFCDSQLGTLKSIHIWHDNYGWSPEWYCDKIHVYDLKCEVKTVFVVDQWLALSPKEYLEEKLIPITKEELNSVKSLFYENFFLGLSEGHVMFSIYFRRTRSLMNRVERISILMSFIMTAFLCSIMFYIPKDEESNVDDYEYEFGTPEIYISIQSLVIGSVVVVILTLSFRRSYAVTRVTQVQSSLYVRNNSTYESEAQSSPNQQGQKSTNPPGISDKDSTSHEDKSKGKSAYSTFVRIVIKTMSAPPLPPIQLPMTVIVVRVRKIWLVIAWSLCITITAVTAYLVMLYGLKLGPVKSKEWLSTVLAATGGETFITDPAKIILFSIILTMAFQRKYEVDTHGVEYMQALHFRVPIDRKYLEELLIKRRHPMYAPILPEIRQEMLRKQKMRSNWLHFMDFIASAFFVVLINIIIDRLWTSNYYANNQVEKLITESHHPDGGPVDFFDIKDISDMEKYLEYTMMYAVYNTRWYNDREISEVQNGNSTDDWLYWTEDCAKKMLGLPKLRQLRTKTKNCGNFLKQEAVCLPKLSEGDKDTDVYGVGWIPAHWTEVHKNNSPWNYTPDPSRFIFTIYRLYGKSGKLYERGGYITTLGPKRPQADLTLAYLRENNWQDARTRVVFLELTLYNANKDLFSHITLTVEYMITGSVLLNARITSVKHSMIFIVWLIIFPCYLVFYSYRCCFLINRQGFFVYLSSITNLFRLFICITGITTVVTYILCYLNIRNYLELFQKRGMDSYFDFDLFTFYFLQLKVCLSVLLCLAIVRMLVSFRFGKSITMYYYSFIISIKWIVWLLLLLVSCIVALHFLSYFLNTYLTYDIPRIVEKYRKVTQYNKPPEYEYHVAKLFLLIKVMSLSIFILLFITLFLYYTKMAR